MFRASHWDGVSPPVTNPPKGPSLRLCFSEWHLCGCCFLQHPFSSARCIIKSKIIASFGKKKYVVPVSHISPVWPPDRAVSSFCSSPPAELLTPTPSTDAVSLGVWCQQVGKWSTTGTRVERNTIRVNSTKAKLKQVHISDVASLVRRYQ